MRFIIDAHLPRQLVQVFTDLGHEAIHTSALPGGNATPDRDIAIVAAKDGVVVSKDGDFYHSFLLYRQPQKMIHVKVGNMRLRAVAELFRQKAP